MLVQRPKRARKPSQKQAEASVSADTQMGGEKHATVEKKTQSTSAPSLLSEKVIEKRQKVSQDARKQVAKHKSSIETAFAKARANLSTPKPSSAPMAETVSESPTNNYPRCSSVRDSTSSSSSSSSSSCDDSKRSSDSCGDEDASASSSSTEDTGKQTHVTPGSLEIVSLSRIVQQHKKTYTTDSSEAWKFFCKFSAPDTKKEYTVCMIPKCGQVTVMDGALLLQVFVFHSSTKNMLDHIQKNHRGLRDPTASGPQTTKLKLKVDAQEKKRLLDLLYASMCAMDFRPHDSGEVLFGMCHRTEGGHEVVSQ